MGNGHFIKLIVIIFFWIYCDQYSTLIHDMLCPFFYYLIKDWIRSSLQ